MTNDEIRIAVAECCGAVWKRQSCSPWNPDDDSRNVYFRRLYFIKPDDVRGPALLPAAFGNEIVADDHDHLPNYPNDLNACHEMEKTLSDEQYTRFEDTLWLIQIEQAGLSVDGPIKIPNRIRGSSAEARQRCEAFLKVKGRWKE